MTLSSTKSSENSNPICNVNLLVWKLINRKILFLLVHLIHMKYSHGMSKLEIFCKLSEGILHQFHQSKWLGRNLSQDLGIKHLKFMKCLLENWMLKHFNTARKLQQLQSIQIESNAQQLRWRVKSTSGTFRLEV